MHVKVMFETTLHGNLVSIPFDDPAPVVLVLVGAHIDWRYEICDRSAGFVGVVEFPPLPLPVATAVEDVVCVGTAPLNEVDAASWLFCRT